LDDLQKTGILKSEILESALSSGNFFKHFDADPQYSVLPSALYGVDDSGRKARLTGKVTKQRSQSLTIGQWNINTFKLASGASV